MLHEIQDKNLLRYICFPANELFNEASGTFDQQRSSFQKKSKNFQPLRIFLSYHKTPFSNFVLYRLKTTGIRRLNGASYIYPNRFIDIFSLIVVLTKNCFTSQVAFCLPSVVVLSFAIIIPPLTATNDKFVKSVICVFLFFPLVSLFVFFSRPKNISA